MGSGDDKSEIDRLDSYSDNYGDKTAEDLLNTKPFDLIFKKHDVHTYIHYNRIKTNVGLFLVTPNMKDNSKPLIAEDTCSGYLQDVAKFLFHPSRYGGPVSRIFWNFRKVKSEAFESHLDI
ncbi:hypothetical protein CDAR_188781 [Caerostris darwini]|uniref:Uncharacterized protein n=1 Tax=Caerostris darwini TaxID=1538125 RepID=A0AAV4VPY4_9ARAC|nr:hypothetical protein CDAR_188781 [Caerostris darwini]